MNARAMLTRPIARTMTVPLPCSIAVIRPRPASIAPALPAGTVSTSGPRAWVALKPPAPALTCTTSAPMMSPPMPTAATKNSAMYQMARHPRQPSRAQTMRWAATMEAILNLWMRSRVMSPASASTCTFATVTATTNAPASPTFLKASLPFWSGWSLTP